jgi:hypothetical protein
MMDRKLGVWFGTALILAAALLLPAAAGAVGSRFVYEVCDSALPGGGTPEVRFVQDAGEPFVAANTCAQPGGALSISRYGNADATSAIWLVGVAITPGGAVESLGVSATACGSPGTVTFAVTNGWPTKACVELYRVFHAGAGTSWIWLGCNTTIDSCPSSSISAHYFAATEVDRVAPSVSGLGGSLLEGGPSRGHQTISATLGDEGGGLSEEAVLVNGVVAGSPNRETCSVVHANNPSVYGTVATTVTPCPTARQVEWTLDTQAYPFRDGANSVQVCGYDFATIGDPNRGCSAPRSVAVDNSCTPSAVAGGELLSARFERSNEETITAGYGQPAAVSGRLATDSDDPVAGATLCVKMETLGVEGHAATVGTVTTDAEGEYRYRVKPGPDRRIVIGYRHDSRQVARDVLYFAHVKPSLRLAPAVLHDGQRVHLWGRLPGPRPRRRVVVLQASSPGSRRWITFRRATTNSAGQFQSSYRFTSTTRRTRYRFRALVPRQDGYPWAEGHSKAAEVLVKG